ncbi:MAG: sigma-70 family RNA polymerase sigma factor [Planctomycetota bacterium]
MADPAETLIVDASRGDAVAIEALLQQYLPGLRAFVRLKAGPGVLARESCSDLAQSVCREVLQHIEQFQHGGAEGFKRWLYARALRKINDRYRHHFAGKRAPAKEAGDVHEQSAWQDACVSFATPSQHAIAGEELSRLEAAFAELTPEQQNVVLWSRFVGMPHREIAAELDKTEAAVRQILSRALAKLAERVDEPAADDG